MAVRTISTKLAIIGEAEYRDKIKSVNDELKTFDSELKLVESQFKGQANSMEALTAKGGALQNVYDKQAEKVGELRGALDNAKEAQAAYNGQIDAVKGKLSAAEAELNDLKNSTGDTTEEQKKAAAQIAKYAKELDEAEGKQAAATRGVNDWQRQLNTAQIKLNDLNGEIAQNKRYLAEADAAADKCATSIDNYGKQTKKAAAETNNLKEKGGLLSKIFSGGFLAGIATQALGALISTLKQVTKEAFDTADKLQTLSSITRLSTDRLQELQYIGDDVGVSLDTISGSLTRLINNMDAASAGSGAAYDSFYALGVKIRDDVTGELLSSVDVFNSVIDALSRMTNETERDAIAQDLLGKSATELNPLIEAGGAAMNRLAEDARNANAIMSAEAVSALDIVGDSASHWWQAIKAMYVETVFNLNNFIAGIDASAWVQAEALKGTADKIAELNAAYDAAYLTAKKSIDAQIGLWTDMSQTADKSLSDIGIALQSQADWLENYSTNMWNLQSRNVEGVDMLVSKLSDGTTESASILAGLATASDDQLRVFIATMAEVEDRKVGLSRHLGEISSDASRQLNDFYNNASQQLNVAEGAAESAQATIGGYIDGALALIPDVEAAFRQIGAAANRAAQSGVTGIVDIRPAARSQSMGAEISRAITGAMGSGMLQPINLNLSVRSELDGRQVANATYKYNLEESALRGPNLVD